MNYMHSEFELVKNLFGKYFHSESDRINSDFKNIISTVYSYEPGELQGMRSCCIGIDVVFHITVEDNSDSLSFKIYLEQEQRLEMNAHIIWGHPTGELVAKMFEEPIVFNETNLKLVQARMPKMIERLREEIRDNPNGK
jgi:hypothetical protein